MSFCQISHEVPAYNKHSATLILDSQTNDSFEPVLFKIVGQSDSGSSLNHICSVSTELLMSVCIQYI